jgi:hypothetical protein
MLKEWAFDPIMETSVNCNSCNILFHCRDFGPDSVAGSAMWPVLDRVDALEADKAHLQSHLVEECDRKAAEMNTSVAVVQ